MIGVPTSPMARTSDRSLGPYFGPMLPRDPDVVLGQHKGNVRDDAEIYSADGEQVCGISGDGHHGKRNCERNRNDEGGEQGSPEVTEEEKKRDRHEDYARGCGFDDLLDHCGDQVPSFIVGHELYSFRKHRAVQFGHLFDEST